MGLVSDGVIFRARTKGNQLLSSNELRERSDNSNLKGEMKAGPEILGAIENKMGETTFYGLGKILNGRINMWTTLFEADHLTQFDL